MKLIHCADLHLDSPMGTHMTMQQASARNTQITDSFLRLTEFARENGVRAVIIAGDLFDGTRVRSRTVDEILAAMERTPEVDYLYLPGNHDGAARAFSDRVLPENLKQFSTDWTTFCYENAAISGVQLCADNGETIYENVPHVPGCVNIAVLHGQAGTVSGENRVNLNALKGRGIDYLALGHIHSFTLQPLDEKGVYCYCGCLEGRGFDECGEKGFVLLDVDEKNVHPTFVPFAKCRLHRVTVDVTGLENNAQIAQAMKQAVAEIPKEDMVEFLLTGHQYYPDELAKWFGGKAENNTDRIRYMAQALQLPMTEAENYDYVKQALREGKIVIQLMNSRSLFTNSQHFILLKGFNENGKIEVYDPSTYNRQSWRLNDRFENGFGTDEICWGDDGAFIFDPSPMSDDPFVYEEPVRPYVEPRYDGLKLTDDETKLLAKLIYVEARGESEEGQQAIAEVVLNRLVSGDFGSSITNMINDESQFVPHKLILTADPSQAQYEAIDRALYGPYVLPKEVTFYGRVRTTDSVWGTIGGHIFCYPWHYKDTHQEITQAN